MEDKKKNAQKRLYESPKVILLDLASSEKCLLVGEGDDPGPQTTCQPGSGPDEWCDCGSDLVVQP